MMKRALMMGLMVAVAACGRLENVGKAPAFTPATGNDEYMAMMSPGLPNRLDRRAPGDDASLWAAGSQSLLGDRRAALKGDILTVVIDINDSAQISDNTQRSRKSHEKMGMGGLFGLPQKIDQNLPDGASMDAAVDLSSDSSHEGDGSVKRKEKVELRIAATILNVLPNGVLEIQGTQEVRVNFELRDLTVHGFVRPDDITRQNTIPYDKIASARIAYGGRGQITDVQQPRYGQQVTDIVLPF